MKTWVRKTLSVGILAAGALLFAPGAAHAGGHGNGFAQVTGANNGILNGTQIGVPINVPINVCGNSLALLGASSRAPAARTPTLRVLRTQVFMRKKYLSEMSWQMACHIQLAAFRNCISGAAVPWRFLLP